MRRGQRIAALDRREFLLSASAGATVSAFLTAFPLLARAEEERRTVQFWNTFRLLTGEATPEEGLVTIALPEIAENGNNVPFEISVDSPMSETDNIKVLHLLSTANPQAAVATYRFSPLSAKATVKGRMRLARTQDVVALAERSDGKFLIGTQRIEVTIGGCGN